MSDSLNSVLETFRRLEYCNSIISDTDYEYDIYKSENLEDGIIVEVYDILSEKEFIFNIPKDDDTLNIKYRNTFISIEELEDQDPDYYQDTKIALKNII